MTTTRRDFDQVAATWDQDPMRVKLAADIAGAIRDEIGIAPDFDVLDFGCGTGLLTLHLQPLVRHILGADSSKGMLTVLQQKIAERKLSNVRVLRLDGEHSDRVDGRFHLIVSSMTFHHIPQVKPLIEKFHAALHPGGRLCIADLDSEGGRFHADNQGVFHFGFDRAALRQELTAAGFVDVRDRTAATVTKSDASGAPQEFTVFLISGRKP